MLLLLLTVACAIPVTAFEAANNPSAKELLEIRKNKASDKLAKRSIPHLFEGYHNLEYLTEIRLKNTFYLSTQKKGLENICACMDQANCNDSATLLNCHKSTLPQLQKDSEALKTNTITEINSLCNVNVTVGEYVLSMLGYPCERLKRRYQLMDNAEKKAFSKIEKKINAIVKQTNQHDRKVSRIERAMPAYQ